MQFGEKLKVCLILLLLGSLVSSHVYAQDGRFIRLDHGDPAPFAAWCFDNEATGHIFGALKHHKEACDLSIEKEIKKQKALYDLRIGKLNLRLESLQKEKNSILLIKNEEIEELEAAALKRPNEYSHWWATGGFAAGVLTALSILALF